MSEQKRVLFKSASLEITTLKQGEKWKVSTNGEGSHSIEERDSNGFLTQDFDSEDEAEKAALRLIYSDKQREYFSRLILSENVIILAGAGSSVLEKKGGKTMTQLWEKASQSIPNFKESILACGLPEEQLDKCAENLESLLSFLSALHRSYVLKGEAENAEKADTLTKQITSHIATECNIKLDDDFRHEELLRKLFKTRAKGKPRVKIFSLNYDTLFEQAASKLRAIAIDGFNFSSTPEFRASSFDYDIVDRENNRVFSEHNFIGNVFQLYKLHGSINWKKNDDGKIYRKDKPSEEPFLIYPGNQKFENTYETPFFELLSRFQRSLREKNTLLIIAGYSFGDKHINQAVLEALKSNVNLHVLVLSSRVITESDDNSSEAQKLRHGLYEKTNRAFKDLVLLGGSNCFSDFVDHMPVDASYEVEEARRNLFQEENDR